MLAIVALFEAGVTEVIDCGTRAPATVSVEYSALVVLEMASLRAGFSPPTRFATATTPLPLPSVRQVCTGTQVAQPEPLVRAERTEPLTTRTRMAAAVLPEVRV